MSGSVFVPAMHDALTTLSPRVTGRGTRLASRRLIPGAVWQLDLITPAHAGACRARNRACAGTTTEEGRVLSAHHQPCWSRIIE